MGVKEVSRERFTESGRSCTYAFKKNIKNVPANACQTDMHAQSPDGSGFLTDN